MLPDCRGRSAGPPVMQEENPLPHAPERRGTELLAVRPALADVVGKSFAHAMQCDVAERRESSIALAGEDSSLPSLWLGEVAQAWQPTR